MIPISSSSLQLSLSSNNKSSSIISLPASRRAVAFVVLLVVAVILITDGTNDYVNNNDNNNKQTLFLYVSSFPITNTILTTRSTSHYCLKQQQHLCRLSSTSTSSSSLSQFPDSQSSSEVAGTVAVVPVPVPVPTPTKSWTDDGFVYGLNGSGLERPKGKVPVLVVDGDTLTTQPYQRVIVGTTFLGHFYFVSSSFQQLLTSTIHHGNIVTTILHTVVLLISAWIIADFGSGVLHWSVDNYGNGRTPIMGSIIAAFQGHHTAPWTITQRGFCNNVYKLCTPFGIIPMIIIKYIMNVSSPGLLLFLSFFCIFEILSQEFHKWSHQLPSETPPWVNTIQKYNLSVQRTKHTQHHIEPFDTNYCIISGICNPILDESGFFRKLEHIIYKLNGVEANSWKLDNNLKMRTLAGDYTLQSE